jgi:hypothetical protein
MWARRIAGWVAVLAVVAPPVASTSAGGDGTDRGPVYRPLCGAPGPGMASCQGEVLTDASGVAVTSTVPAGHGAGDIRHAYRLPSLTKGVGQTVAIVDAYDDPNAESDQTTYRSTFSLPACTSASGCFRKVNQTGGTTYPTPDKSWSGEMSLDLDMVAATCPLCHVLLVEANSASLPDLAASVDTAAALGATEISNSYARAETKNETSFDVHYHHPGIMITVASGNGTYSAGATYPAASPYVTAVGGTTLARASNGRGWTETVWAKTSSGCSLYEPKPAWQHDPGCSGRTVADTSAVALNLAVYDSYQQSGWVKDYGTSAPTPIIASVYALAGNAASLTFGSSTYQAGASLFDITAGTTGTCGTYLFQGSPGYDGPSGNGVPNGVSAF